MKVRKAIFVIGGTGIFLILIAIRFGWIDKIREAFRAEGSAAHEKASLPATPQPKPATPPAKTTAPPRPAASPAPEKTETPPAAPKAAAAPSAESDDGKNDPAKMGMGDPFVYTGSGADSHAPLSGGKQVGTIVVKGIIHMEGGEPKAILYLKDSGRVHYVSKDSVIRIGTKGQNGSSPTEAYIVIKDIRDDEVELIQLERPDKVIIIR